MNLIPKIAEMLGVEIGERFLLSNESHDEGEYYYFNGHELCHHISDKKPDYAQYSTLADLVMGDKKIIKFPFEPKMDERYFYISVVDKVVNASIWRGNTTDCCYKVSGNCFRTEVEAEKHRYEIYERLTGKKWEEKCDT